MYRERLVFLIVPFLLCTSPCAHAQGTYTSGIRHGYGGATTSPPSTHTPAASTSSPSSGNRNSTATGPDRSQGALGITPQLQRELGIGRQQ
jgi:hypothetical protein